MGRRLTLGIGDNREHCFYIPVGFHLMRQYIDNGFELEELVSALNYFLVALGRISNMCRRLSSASATALLLVSGRTCASNLTF